MLMIVSAFIWIILGSVASLAAGQTESLWLALIALGCCLRGLWLCFSFLRSPDSM